MVRNKNATLKPMFSEKFTDYHVEEATKKYSNQLEKTLGIGLLQPFEAANSSSRKILANNQEIQSVVLDNPNVPYISSGYEKKIGERSSSIIRAEGEETVIGKIQRFTHYHNKKYTMITLDMNNKLRIYYRVGVKYNTEMFGFTINNDAIDGLDIGDKVSAGNVLSMSKAFDKYENHMGGVNLNATYMSLAENNNDPVVISKSASRKLAMNKILDVTIQLNENDVPTNLYGTINNYKCFPDIGEKLVDCKIARIRKITNEEILYTLSDSNLKQEMMNDTVFRAPYDQFNDMVVEDIEVLSNNKDILNSNEAQHSQLKYYINDHMRYCREIVELLEPYMNNNDYIKDWKVEEEYETCRRILNGDQFYNDGQFNIKIKITVKCFSPIEQGDKIANRYGGKGVISEIRDDDQMPYTVDGVRADVIWNLSGVVNRENNGQMLEQHINNFSRKLVGYIDRHLLHPFDAIKLIFRFICIINPEYAAEFLDLVDYTGIEAGGYSEEDVAFILASLVGPDDCLYLVCNPATNCNDLDTLRKLSEFMRDLGIETTDRMYGPVEGSNGVVRMVPTKKVGIVGSCYVIRLKQLADDKHSSISLAATNIRGENTKDKQCKMFTGVNGGTPVRNGNMEAGIMSTNMGSQHYIIEQMIRCDCTAKRSSYEKRMLAPSGSDVEIEIHPEDKNKRTEAALALCIARGLGFKIVKYRRKIKNAFIKIVNAFVPTKTNIFGQPVRKPDEVKNAFIKKENLFTKVSDEEYEKYKNKKN